MANSQATEAFALAGFLLGALQSTKPPPAVR